MAGISASDTPAGPDPAVRASQSLAFLTGMCICLMLAGGLAAGAIAGSAEPACVYQVERINPNDAPTASLARLPGIGVARARAIVMYRSAVRLRAGEGRAFQSADDLQKVKGIGPAIVAGIRPWLQFDEPSTGSDRSGKR
jgi:competence protein ComEA